MRMEGELLAGSAVSYRKARLRTGAEVDVGIMTGSWTLPAARGQGCFTRAILESVKLTESREGALLLAYVTEANASSRRLVAAGSGLFPTRYVFSTDETPAAREDAPPAFVAKDSEKALSRMAERLEHQREGCFRMWFPSLEALRGQVLERPGEAVVLLEHGEGGRLGHSVVETSTGSDRIQLLAPAEPASLQPCLESLLARAQDGGRQLFLFSSSPDEDARFRALGLTVKPGFLTALVADAVRLGRALGVETPWESGDSTPLSRPESPWFLGSAAVQSGERM